MTLREFLTRHANVGEIVIIRENGWQVAMTRVDNNKLYLGGLSPRLLDDCEVINFTYESRDWATVIVLVIEVLPTKEVSRRVREGMVSR